jgi:hypothetical protein
MMKSVVVFLAMGLLVALVPSISAADYSSVNVRAVNFSEPPFWMLSFDEFKDLRPEQKNFYIKRLREELLKIPQSPSLSQDQWSEAKKDSKSWSQFMTKVYQFCMQNKKTKACAKLTDTRVATLEMFAVKQ